MTNKTKEILSGFTMKQLEILRDVLIARAANDLNKVYEIIKNSENDDCRVIHEYFVKVLATQE